MSTWQQVKLTILFVLMFAMMFVSTAQNNISTPTIIAQYTYPSSLLGTSLSPDEQLILAWYWDGTARIWNIQSNDVIVLHHEKTIRDARWNHDGSLVLTASLDGSVRIWNKYGDMLFQLQHSGEVNGAIWNSDETQILSWDGMTLYVWNAQDGSLKFKTFFADLMGVFWTKDDQAIVAYSRDGSVTLWSLDGVLLISLDHLAMVRGVSLNRDYSKILTWSNDGTAKVWDSNNGRLIHTINHSGTVLGAEWNSSETKILSWSMDGTAQIWDEITNTSYMFKHDDIVVGGAWSNHDEYVITWSWDGTIQFWNNVGEHLFTLIHGRHTTRDQLITDPKQPVGNHVSIAIWNKSDSLILSVSNDLDVCTFDGCIFSAWIWNNAGQLVAKLPHRYIVRGASWNLDNSQIMTWSLDGHVKIWDLQGTLIADLIDPNGGGGVFGAIWNQKEDKVLYWTDSSIYLWDIP